MPFSSNSRCSLVLFRIFLPYTASLCMAFSLTSTFMSVFKLNLSGIPLPDSSMHSKFKLYLDFMPFLILSTVFKITALTFIATYLTYLTVFPLATLLIFSVVVTEKTLENEEDLRFPKALMIILSLFVPICFASKQSANFFKIQTKYFIWQTLVSVGVYGITLIVVCIMVNMSKLLMYEKLTITNTEFNIYVFSIMAMGILSSFLSFHPRSSNLVKEMKLDESWVPFVIGMRSIFTVLLIMIPFVIPNILEQSNQYSSINFKENGIVHFLEATTIIPIDDQICGTLGDNILTVNKSNWDKEKETIQKKLPAAILILDNVRRLPSSPLPKFKTQPHNTLPILLLNKDSSDMKFLEYGRDIILSNSTLKFPDEQLLECINKKIIRKYHENEKYYNKVLIFNGGSENVANSPEVFDINKPDLQCTLKNQFQKLPTTIEYGGMLGSNPIVCGEKHCIAVDQSRENIKMEEKRLMGSSVELNSSTLWVVGGINDRELKSTEFISRKTPVIYQQVPGPKLNFSISGHCMVMIDPFQILLIGGKQNNSKSNASWVLNPQNDLVRSGPSMRQAKWLMACGKMHIEGQTIVVTAGGSLSGGEYSNSTELLTVSTNLYNRNWTQGKWNIRTINKYFL